MVSDRETSPLLSVGIHHDTSAMNGVNYGSNNISSNYSDASKGITFSWENISAFAQDKQHQSCSNLFSCCGKKSEKNDKQILDNVSGIVKPGTLLAILGASGAGKTTLLNVLNQRNIRRLKVHGDMRVNGMQLGNQIAAISGYVQQDDLFLGRLTVKEHLWFNGMLRMDQKLTLRSRLQRIEEVMQELGLNVCANTQIGIPGKFVGISGGERKRLAFASEVLTNPALFFCDEPTSGLDSFMAENIVQTLRVMASKGKTIICTIHQPSSQVYSLFDQVLFMAQGRVAYMGKTSDLPEFFRRLGNTCPTNFNPADYYIHALAVIPGREEACYEEIQTVCNAYQTSLQFDNMKAEINRISQFTNDSEFITNPLKYRSSCKASWFTQFWLLLWRAFKTNMREPSLSRAKLFQNVFAALLFGVIFYNQSYDQHGVQNMNGALFIFMINLSFGSVFPVINAFIPEFPVFMREHHSGMYQTGIYFISKTLAEVPIYLFVPFVFNSIAYWMIGFYRDAVTFLIATGTLLLVCNCAVSFGYVISCLSSNYYVVLAIAPVALVPIMLFGGFFLNVDTIPSFLVWFKYISWFIYGHEILIVNQWHNVKNISCDHMNGYNSSLVSEEFSGKCYRNGQDVIHSLSFHEENVWLDFVLLTTLLIGFRVLAYLFLFLRSRRRD